MLLETLGTLNLQERYFYLQDGKNQQDPSLLSEVVASYGLSLHWEASHLCV